MNVSDHVLDDLLDTPLADEPVPNESTVAPRRAPRAPARRPAAPRRPAAIRVYQRSRGAVGLSLIALLFALAWLLNGAFTAQAVVRLGGDWTLGISIHLIITAVELTTVFVAPALRAIQTPAAVVIVIWLIVLSVGILDTLTSALAFSTWGLALGLSHGLSLHLGSTVLAELIAFLPEPMLVWIFAALVRMLKA